MTKKALLVGINYRNKPFELHGCINDVSNVHKILTDKYNFTEVDILTDDTHRKPTKRNIMFHLNKLIKKSRKDDVIVLYFSGHGTSIPDSSGDEVDGLDEAILCIDGQLIVDDEINYIVNRVYNKCKLYMFFDCCRSGTIGDLEYNVSTVNTDSIGRIEFNFGKSTNNSKQVCIFSGCRENENAIESVYTRPDGSSESGGAFTSCLLQVLNDSYNSDNMTNAKLCHQLNNLLTSSGVEQRVHLSCTMIDLPLRQLFN